MEIIFRFWKNFKICREHTLIILIQVGININQSNFSKFKTFLKNSISQNFLLLVEAMLENIFPTLLKMIKLEIFISNLKYTK